MEDHAVYAWTSNKNDFQWTRKYKSLIIRPGKNKNDDTYGESRLDNKNMI